MEERIAYLLSKHEAPRIRESLFFSPRDRIVDATLVFWTICSPQEVLGLMVDDLHLIFGWVELLLMEPILSER